HEGAHTVVGGPEPHDMGSPLGRERGAVVGGEVTTMAVVARRATCRLGVVIARRELVGSAEALVGVPAGDEPRDRGAVLLEARALADRPFVPVEAEPPERVGDADDGFFGR